MDLSQFDTVSAADRGASLQLSHPLTGAPLVDEASKQPVTINVLGADSHKYTDLLHRAKNKARAALAKHGKKAVRTAEETEAEELEVAVKCTVGWSYVSWQGQPLPFSEANARMLYTERPWVLEQVQEFMEDRTNYLGN